MTLFELAPYIALAWAVCFITLAAWWVVDTRRLIREEQAEEERRDREDREVEALETIPVPGDRWEMVA
jgi:heme exporter protein D